MLLLHQYGQTYLAMVITVATSRSINAHALFSNFDVLVPEEPSSRTAFSLPLGPFLSEDAEPLAVSDEAIARGCYIALKKTDCLNRPRPSFTQGPRLRSTSFFRQLGAYLNKRNWKVQTL